MLNRHQPVHQHRLDGKFSSQVQMHHHGGGLEKKTAADDRSAGNRLSQQQDKDCGFVWSQHSSIIITAAFMTHQQGLRSAAPGQVLVRFITGSTDFVIIRWEKQNKTIRVEKCEGGGKQHDGNVVFLVTCLSDTWVTRSACGSCHSRTKNRQRWIRGSEEEQPSRVNLRWD